MVKESSKILALTQRTLALVLASSDGLGLKDLTAWRAKASLHFGGNYRLVDFALSNCVNSGLRRIGVLVQYKSHSLIRHLQRAWGFMRAGSGECIDILPAQQRTAQKQWYQGTADALFQNLDIIRRYQCDYVLVVNGGHIYTMDYANMLLRHVHSGADMSVGCISMSLDGGGSSGILSVDEDGRITHFTPAQPSGEGLVPIGVYLFSRDFLYDLLYGDAAKSCPTHDFVTDIIPSIIQCARVFAFPFCKADGESVYWRDMDTVDSYWQANMDLCAITPKMNLYDKDWPFWTYQRHEPPAKIITGDNGQPGSAVDSLISSGCLLSGARVKQSLIFPGTRIRSHSLVNASVVLPRVMIGKHCRLTKTVIDKEAIIPDGMVIGEDTSLDRQRFHVTQGGVVLVTSGMLALLKNQSD